MLFGTRRKTNYREKQREKAHTHTLKLEKNQERFEKKNRQRQRYTKGYREIEARRADENDDINERRKPYSAELWDNEDKTNECNCRKWATLDPMYHHYTLDKLHFPAVTKYAWNIAIRFATSSSLSSVAVLLLSPPPSSFLFLFGYSTETLVRSLYSTTPLY